MANVIALMAALFAAAPACVAAARDHGRRVHQLAAWLVTVPATATMAGLMALGLRATGLIQLP